VLINRVSPNFFAAVGQPVIRGRGLSEGDTASSQFVAVINQAFAKKYFPNEDPVGRHFGIYDREDFGAYEIVGVVADAKYKQPRENAQAMFFGPLSQWQHNLKNPTAINLETQTHYITSVVMRFRGVPQNLDVTLRDALAHIDPNLTILDLRSLDQQLAGNFNQERLVARLTALFGLLTLVLASVGLYGIASYQVAQRTREIGLRMALGAQRNRMAALVMRAALIQVGLGLAAGVPISLLGAHWIQSQLYGVKSYDPLSLFVAIVILSTAAMLASFLPARRAASIDPMQALRAD
jgi:predicted permease